MGGVGSALTGGNFWEGVKIGTFVALFNHYLHKMNYDNSNKSKNGPPGKIVGLKSTTKGHVLLIQYETPAGYFIVEKYMGFEQVSIKGKIAEISVNSSNGKYEGTTIELNIGTGKIGTDYTEVSIGSSFKGVSIDAAFGINRMSLDTRYTNKQGIFEGYKFHFVPSTQPFKNALQKWGNILGPYLPSKLAPPPIMPFRLPIPL